jgi:TonB-dependent SusC/RagA subfamily outer membrane receptor
LCCKPAVNALNEVVVTGYTSQRKKDISGSVATVNVTAAKSVPSVSSESLLQGQAAGVNVITQGAPGAGAQVTIRGTSNFGNSSPLYVIDGLQATNMSNISPNDIESISVLKDAGAAAIYGVSGGNGVVLVTTKKGKQGKTTISYDAIT